MVQVLVGQNIVRVMLILLCISLSVFAFLFFAQSVGVACKCVRVYVCVRERVCVRVRVCMCVHMPHDNLWAKKIVSTGNTRKEIREEY